MDKTRFTLLFLSFMMAVWRLWKKAYNTHGTDGTLDQPAKYGEFWKIYLPPLYSNVSAIGEVLLFVIPAGYFHITVLFAWNHLIEYGVHYEMEMDVNMQNVSITALEDVRNIELILTSDTHSLVTIVTRSDHKLVFTVWFHPRTYINIVRFLINIPTYWCNLAGTLRACEDFFLKRLI